MPHNRTRLASAFLALALLAASCSSSSDDSSATTNASATSTTTSLSTTTAADTITTGAPTAVEASDFFDSSVLHTISVEFDQTSYDEMVAIYSDTEDKEWIEATVTVDGIAYPQAGLRLKGNSSLFGLLKNPPPAAALPPLPDDLPANCIPPGLGGPPGSAASADQPQELPWLIRLDKFVDDQNHNGITDIVIRSNDSATALNEAVALDLLAAANLNAQKAVSTRFSINGGEEALRLAIEHPKGEWMRATFGEGGTLYKAKSDGNYDYRGDDPEAYDGIFKQAAGKKNTDMTPLIEFLDFINNSDDSAFASELPGRLDVDLFADYLAMQDLIDNFDDIDGPGNNSYLYYDVAAERFTVVPWDMNLAYSGLNDVFNGELPPIPEGCEALANLGPPPDLGGSNILRERFVANDDFRQMYEISADELTASLHDSGTAAELLNARVALLKAEAADLVDPAVVDEDAAAISSYFSPGE